jgi:HNH endonuclease
MDAATRQLVRERAGNRCEYCGLHQDHSPVAALHVEHIIPRKHGGSDAADNLALACIDCNLRKGTNLAGYDPATGQLTELFHPRRQLWHEHFEWRGIELAGRTAIGRATVEVLDMNSEDRLELRVVSGE